MSIERLPTNKALEGIGVRGYKRFKAVVAADALRRYQSGACVNGAESGGDSSDSEIERSGRQDLIDLLGELIVINEDIKFFRKAECYRHKISKR